MAALVLLSTLVGALALGYGTAEAGFWATVAVLNEEDFAAPVPAGGQTVLAQVLQHGTNPLADAEVTVRATLGETVVETQATPEALPVQSIRGNANGGQPGRGDGASETAVVYVARIDLPRPGEWSVEVEGRHPVFPILEENPVRLTVQVVDDRGAAPLTAGVGGAVAVVLAAGGAYVLRRRSQQG